MRRSVRERTFMVVDLSDSGLHRTVLYFHWLIQDY